jgi:hypothetical protein
MNPTELHKSLLEKGAEKARTQAFFTSRDRYRKQVRAKWVVHYINAGQTVGKSEHLALLEAEYIDACEEAEMAEASAGVAAVAYEAAHAWFRAWQTLESTKRAEMTLR